MSTEDGWRDKLDISGHVLFIVLVAFAYISMFTLHMDLFTTSEIFALIVLGVIYTIVGIYGERVCQHADSLWAALTYFAIQIPLSMSIFYLSSGLAWLVMLPLVGEGVELLWERNRVLAGAVLILISITPIIITAPRLIELYQTQTEAKVEDFSNMLLTIAQVTFQYILGVAFVALFTYSAVHEQEARAEAERLAVELAEANSRLREYAVQSEELATIKERNRLAREIHDSLGHYLTVVNVQIAAARTVIDDDRPRALDALDKAQKLAQEGLAEIRRSVAALRASPMEGRPLPEAVEALAEESRAAGINIELDVSGAPRPLSPQTALALYRSAQEGMTNVRKHAQVANAEIKLDYGEDGKVRLTINDDGLGSEKVDGGFGLLGVRERVRLLDGEVNIRTAPGQGFVLEVEVSG